MDLLSRVRQFVGRHRLIRSSSRVLVAVSGGSDSVALAHVLHDLAAAGDLQIAGLAHFNHQLRSSAERDEAFVADLARSLDLVFIADREDVAARARVERRSIEAAARTARHAFFERARASIGADVVALGHTRDDQAETVLLRLTRGAGPRGLSGMHPRNGCVVRPLLGCRRSDLREWLAERRLPFVEDETNADVSIPRNRMRAELLPLLAARFNPNIVEVLADQAEIAREIWAWMHALTADLEDRTVRRSTTAAHEPVREIDVASLIAAPIAVQRALLWRVMNEVGGRRAIAFGHIDAALRLIHEGRDTRADFPGQRLERFGPTVVLTGRRDDAEGRRPVADPSILFRVPLSIPGEVALPHGGGVISAAPLNVAPAEWTSAAVGNGARAVLVRRDLCRGSLAVRNRRPGDRFRPAGLAGQKKLQDYFVDRKVARKDRDAVPLVVDQTDRIVWVAGYAIDETFRVTDAAQAVLILEFTAVGGSV